MVFVCSCNQTKLRGWCRCLVESLLCEFLFRVETRVTRYIFCCVALGCPNEEACVAFSCFMRNASSIPSFLYYFLKDFLFFNKLPFSFSFFGFVWGVGVDTLCISVYVVGKMKGSFNFEDRNRFYPFAACCIWLFNISPIFSVRLLLNSFLEMGQFHISEVHIFYLFSFFLSVFLAVLFRFSATLYTGILKL